MKTPAAASTSSTRNSAVTDATDDANGLSDAHLVRLGADVLRKESTAVAALVTRLDERFATACRTLLDVRGRIVVCGMGKSGHIGSKIAATLASTGSPAFFVHPAEAGHGDLGMITRDDAVLALSNSGETSELKSLLPVLHRLDVPIVAITGRMDSSLAREATIALDASISEEACPHDLAPTSSTTAALALGDALAVALLQARGFSEADFARSHPGGTLGRRLLIYVRDVMKTGNDVPCVSIDDSLQVALVEMSSKALGMTAVLNRDQTLAGVFTDGDLRRALGQGVDVYQATMRDLMTPDPVTTQADILAIRVVETLREHAINGLIVIDEQRNVVGALNNQTLLHAGVL